MKKYKLTKDELILFGITVTNNIRDFVMNEDCFIDDFLSNTGIETQPRGRYKVGDNAVVVYNLNLHGFEIGTVVVLKEHPYPKTWQCYDDIGRSYGLTEDELSEPFTRLK